ncbi:MAG TPA: PRC-barrel domain-containing protein [Leptospiraceae bacterium]|jgi:hypothetical protein|nr:PRC-barrel domain-containing protein [Leptospirales bacterium]HMU82881.1 PRC-barrel domain-containing protein [Leptospiraceae bacterium]HMW59696.1 PRC-barrel domain-containing protein [Leptospiraceae bacterium]HMX57957.1 PRC-barrel domain-containing protein [Leptospiraceae bacterium]HMY46834.1 PRC-barrel domain-containing protein [Leptospiraceae bacterium]
MRPGEDPLAPLQPDFIPDLKPATMDAMRPTKDGASARIVCDLEVDLTGSWVYAARELWAEKDSVYVYEILGARIVDSEGKDRGEVKDYFETGSTGVLTVDSGGKVVMIPSIDQFVDYSRLKEGIIIVPTFDDFL